MILRWLFRHLSDTRKIELLSEQGVMLGSQMKNQRRVFLYMIKDFFVEVTYKDDDREKEPEKIESFTSLKKLNHYLESESPSN